MKTIAIAVIAVFLSACAATTPQLAREMGPERRYVFEVDSDYQTTYRRILDVARNCYPTNLITASMIVNGDLYPDSKTGVVTVGLYGIMTQIYKVIDVRGLDGSHTEVVAIFPIGPVKAVGHRIEAWANATGTEC